MTEFELEARRRLAGFLARKAKEYGWRPPGAESPEFPDPHLGDPCLAVIACELAKLAEAEDAATARKILRWGR